MKEKTVHRVSATENKENDRCCFRVSESSSWNDTEWKLHRGDFHLDITLAWSFNLPNGEISTHSKYGILLESFKEVIWGMLTVDNGYGKILNIGSAQLLATGMRDLFRWLALRGYTSFADLSERAQEEYLQDLPNILSDRNKFFGLNERNRNLRKDVSHAGTTNFSTKSSPDDVDFSVEDEEEDDSPESTDNAMYEDFGYAQVGLRVKFLFYIYHQTDALNARSLPALPAKPFHGEKAASITNRIAIEYRNRIPPLPDEILLPLLSAVHEWVSYKSTDAIALTKIYWDTRNAIEQGHLRSASKYKILNTRVTEMTFSTLPGHSSPWRDSLSKDTHNRHSIEGKSPASIFTVARHIIKKTADACYLTLLYLVGLRPSELCAVEAGQLGPDELPTCIETKINKSGLLKLYFLKSYQTKGVPSKTQNLWLIGCSPVDSNEMPITVRAVLVLYHLFAHWRSLSKCPSLGLAFSNPHGLPNDQNQVRGIYPKHLIKSTRIFIFQEVDLSNIPTINAHGENLEKYRATRGKCITPYHGRKSFSAFMLEVRTSLLEPIRRHFKHLNVSMTESAYFPALYRLRQEQESYATAETIRYLSEIVLGKASYGKIVDSIKLSDDVLSYKDMPLLQVEKFMAEKVRTHDLRIFFSDHGNCFIRLSPTESRCKSTSDTSSWMINAPDYSVRTPSLCAGCNCFVMDKSHIPFWKRRANALSDQMTADGNVNRVIKSRATQAFKILKILRTLDD